MGKNLKPLNPQQERFCAEYVVDYNATQAAKRAGYSEKTAYSQGNRLLKNAEVLARVREYQQQQVSRLAISSDWVVQQLVDVYLKCSQPVPVMVWNPDTKQKEESGEYTFDSKGALNALEQLSKHTGGFNGEEKEDKTIHVKFVDESLTK